MYENQLNITNDIYIKQQKLKNRVNKGIFSEIGTLEIEVTQKCKSLRSSIVQLLRLREADKVNSTSPDDEIKTDNITGQDLRQLIIDNLGNDIVNSIDGSFEYNEKIKHVKERLKDKKIKNKDLQEQIRSLNERISDYDMKIDLLNQELSRRTKQMELHRDKFYTEYIALHTLVFEKKSDPESLVPHDAWIRINHFLDLEDAQDNSKDLTLAEKRYKDAQREFADFMSQSMREKEDIRLEYQRQINDLKLLLHQEQRKKHLTHEEAHQYARKQEECEKELKGDINTLKHSIQEERDMFALKQLEWNKEKELILATTQGMNSLDKEEAQKLRDSFMIAIGSYDDKMSDLQKHVIKKLDEFNNRLVGYEDTFHDLMEKQSKYNKFKQENEKIVNEMREDAEFKNKMLLEKTENENQLKNTINQLQSKLLKNNKNLSKKKEKKEEVQEVKEVKEEDTEKTQKLKIDLKVAQDRCSTLEKEIDIVNQQWKARLNAEVNKVLKEKDEIIADLNNEIGYKSAKALKGGNAYDNLRAQYEEAENLIKELREVESDYSVISSREKRLKNEITNYGFLELIKSEEEREKRINHEIEVVINLYSQQIEEIQYIYSFLDDIKTKIDNLQNSDNADTIEVKSSIHYLKLLYNYCTKNEVDTKLSLYTSTFSKLCYLVHLREENSKEFNEKEWMYMEELQSRITRCDRLKRDDNSKTIKRDLPKNIPIYAIQTLKNPFDINKYIERLYDRHLDYNIENNEMLNERILMLQEDLRNIPELYELSDDIHTDIDDLIPETPIVKQSSIELLNKTPKNYNMFSPQSLKIKSKAHYKRRKSSQIGQSNRNIGNSIDTIDELDEDYDVDIPEEPLKSVPTTAINSRVPQSLISDNNIIDEYDTEEICEPSDSLDDETAESFFNSATRSPSRGKKSQSPITSPKDILNQYLQNTSEVEDYKNELKELIEKQKEIEPDDPNYGIYQERIKDVQNNIQKLVTSNVGLSQVLKSSPLHQNFAVVTDNKIKEYKENKENITNLYDKYHQLETDFENMIKNNDFSDDNKLNEMEETRSNMSNIRKDIQKFEIEMIKSVVSKGGLDSQLMVNYNNNVKKIDEMTNNIKDLQKYCKENKNSDNIKDKKKEILNLAGQIKQLFKDNSNIINQTNHFVETRTAQIVNQIHNEKDSETFVVNNEKINILKNEIEKIKEEIKANPNNEKMQEKLLEIQQKENQVKAMEDVNELILQTARKSIAQAEEFKSYKKNNRISIARKRKSSISPTSPKNLITSIYSDSESQTSSSIVKVLAPRKNKENEKPILYKADSNNNSNSNKSNILKNISTPQKSKKIIQLVKNGISSKSPSNKNKGYKVYDNYENDISDDLLDNENFYIEFDPLDFFYVDEFEDSFYDNNETDENKLKIYEKENRFLKDKLDALKHTLSVLYQKQSKKKSGSVSNKSSTDDNNEDTVEEEEVMELLQQSIEFINETINSSTPKETKKKQYTRPGRKFTFKDSDIKFTEFDLENKKNKKNKRNNDLVNRKVVDRDGVAIITLANNKNNSFLPELPNCPSSVDIKHSNISTPIYSPKNLANPNLTITPGEINTIPNRFLNRNPISNDVLTPVHGKGLIKKDIKFEESNNTDSIDTINTGENKSLFSYPMPELHVYSDSIKQNIRSASPITLYIEPKKKHLDQILLPITANSQRNTPEQSRIIIYILIESNIKSYMITKK